MIVLLATAALTAAIIIRFRPGRRVPRDPMLAALGRWLDQREDV